MKLFLELFVSFLLGGVFGVTTGAKILKGIVNDARELVMESHRLNSEFRSHLKTLSAKL